MTTHDPARRRHRHDVLHHAGAATAAGSRRSWTPRASAYTEVNIEEHPDAAALVEPVNGGNQTVPTVVFPDGSAATNPSLAEVQRRGSS